MRYLELFCTFLICIVAAKADHCSPGIVEQISLNSDYYLNWSKALNPNNCTITGYVINVYDLEDNTKLEFQTNNYTVLSYNFYFLDMCTTYSFEVHALTDTFVLGPSINVNFTTPPSKDMDLSLILNHAVSRNDSVDISWNTKNSTVSNCVSYYRVIYWDENNNPTDVYVPNNNISLPMMVPCMKYNVQVTAIVTNPDLEGPTSELNLTEAATVPPAPKLVNMTTTSTSVTMFWKLPTYNEHRCQLNSLVVTTLGAPANNTYILVSLVDNRADVGVSVNWLSPEDVYTSFVALTNVAGSSKNVTVSYQTSDKFIFKFKEDLKYYLV